MNEYEIMVIAKASLKEEGAKTEFKKVTDLLNKHKAKDIKEDYWGKRDFSYPIDGMLEGFYTVINFSLDPKEILPIKAQLNIEEGVVRYLLTRPGK